MSAVTEHSARVLCVDDELFVLKSLQRLFLDSDFEVVTAGSAMEALATMRKTGGFSLIISDYRMPGMNGVRFFQEVFKEWPDTVRIILSGYADTTTVLDAINNGHVDKFIPKPWEDDELLAMVEAELSSFSNKQIERINLRKGYDNLSEQSARLMRVVDAQQLALRTSEARLRDAQRIALLGDWEWNMVTDETSWSEEMYRIHGVSSELYQPSSRGYEGLLPEADQELYRRELTSCLGNLTRGSFEHKVRLPGGEIRNMQVHCEIMYDLDGNPLGLRGTTQDITEKVSLIENLHKSQKELQELNAELEQRVKQRTAELEAANRELELFNSAVAHDLRAPVGSMLMGADLLKHTLGKQLDKRAVLHIDQIIQKGNQAVEMMSALLELSRMNSCSLVREQLDLSAMIWSVFAELRQGDPGREVAVSVQEGMIINADRTLLETVLLNLLGNAWKYTGHTEHPQIEAGKTGDAEPTWFVRDNGAGFDMRLADTLFAPFRRLHGDKEFSGHGVGLASVERIVRRHGGKIWADASPGNGATFYFTLGDS